MCVKFQWKNWTWIQGFKDECCNTWQHSWMILLVDGFHEQVGKIRKELLMVDGGI